MLDLPVGSAGRVKLLFVDNMPVVTEVVPQAGWTPTVTSTGDGVIAVRFDGPASSASLELHASLGGLRLVVDPGSDAPPGGYQTTRSLSFGAAGTGSVAYSSSGATDVEISPAQGWQSQFAVTAPNRLSINLVGPPSPATSELRVSLPSWELIVKTGRA